jgi:SAM-dependent methyltransferase
LTPSGDGGYAAALHGLGFCALGVDYAPTAVATARAPYVGPLFACLDIALADPTGPGTFDVITCRLAYAFLDRPHFLASARALLAPGGVLHVTTPHTDRIPQRPGIGINDHEIAELRDGWANSIRYDLDYLIGVVCRKEE